MKRFRVALVLASTFAARSADAQVRYDAAALAGYSQRFVAGNAAEGGALTLDAHVALIPLVRIGAWASAEASDVATSGELRGIFSGGARVKILAPWPRGVWHAWIATGFGYDALATRDAGGGGFFEVPAIVGASYRVRRPFVFVMELGAHVGFGFWGSYYDAHKDADVIALTLSFGFGVD